MKQHPSVRGVIAAASLLLLVLGPSVAQDAPQGLSERIEVRAVNLEVVVTDRDGQRVVGLESDAFTLLVDGEEVAFDLFSEVREGKVIDSPNGVPELGGDQSRANILIFIDEFFTIKADKTKVLRELASRVANLQAGDRVAMTAWDGQTLDVLTDWTGSQDDIRAALEKALDRPSHGLRREQERRQYNTSMTSRDRQINAARTARDPFNLGTQERIYADLLIHQLQATVGAAAASLRGLEVLPGRKVMLLLSGGWPIDPAQFVGGSVGRAISESGMSGGADLYGGLAETANLLGYTLYGVDAPGLQTRTGTDASQRRPTPTRESTNQFYLEGEIHHSLLYLAHETGGLALLNGQRVSALDEVAADLRSYYWLSLTPELSLDDEIYDLEVRLNDPQLQVRTRSSYRDASRLTIRGLYALLLQVFALPVVFVTGGVMMLGLAHFARYIPRRL